MSDQLTPDMWEWFRRNPKSDLNFRVDGKIFQRVVYHKISMFGRAYEAIMWRDNILFMRHAGNAPWPEPSKPFRF